MVISTGLRGLPGGTWQMVIFLSVCPTAKLMAQNRTVMRRTAFMIDCVALVF